MVKTHTHTDDLFIMHCIMKYDNHINYNYLYDYHTMQQENRDKKECQSKKQKMISLIDKESANAFRVHWDLHQLHHTPVASNNPRKNIDTPQI